MKRTPRPHTSFNQLSTALSTILRAILIAFVIDLTAMLNSWAKLLGLLVFWS